MTIDQVCERVRFYAGIWNELPVIAQGVVVLLISLACSFILLVMNFLRDVDGRKR